MENYLPSASYAEFLVSGHMCVWVALVADYFHSSPDLTWLHDISSRGRIMSLQKPTCHHLLHDFFALTCLGTFSCHLTLLRCLDSLSQASALPKYIFNNWSHKRCPVEITCGSSLEPSFCYPENMIWFLSLKAWNMSIAPDIFLPSVDRFAKNAELIWHTSGEAMTMRFKAQCELDSIVATLQ